MLLYGVQFIPTSGITEFQLDLVPEYFYLALLVHGVSFRFQIIISGCLSRYTQMHTKQRIVLKTGRIHVTTPSMKFERFNFCKCFLTYQNEHITEPRREIK
jgi:hypothetical protein